MIAICLLGLVIVDAVGDALRLKGKQILHHLAEALQIGGWLAIWAFLGFEWVYVPIYILGRLWLFDVIFNIVAGNRILYVGESDLWGLSIRGIAKLFKVQYEHPSFIFKFMSLIAWAGLITC